MLQGVAFTPLSAWNDVPIFLRVFIESLQLINSLSDYRTPGWTSLISNF